MTDQKRIAISMDEESIYTLVRGGVVRVHVPRFDTTVEIILKDVGFDLIKAKVANGMANVDMSAVQETWDE